MLKQFSYGLIITLLLSACSTGTTPNQQVLSTPEKISPRSSPSNVQVKIESGTQEGGAQQGITLNLKYLVSTIAGKAGVSGAVDGNATKAHFNLPQGITIDGRNLYVADLSNHTIRKIEIATGSVSTIAGLAGKKGSADGKGSAARFNRPFGITTDGNLLYVTDSNNHSVRQIVINSGKVTTLAGRTGESGRADNVGKDARFFIPEGITTDGSHLYIADTHNHAVRMIKISSGEVTTIAGTSGTPGFLNDVGIKSQFYFPKGITTDGKNLYVADFGNHLIRKIVLKNGLVSTLAGVAIIEGANMDQENYRFNYPSGITSDGRYLYVADTLNRTIRRVSIASGEVSLVAGKVDMEGVADGQGLDARFKYPVGIATDGSSLYVTDANSHTIRRVRQPMRFFMSKITRFFLP